MPVASDVRARGTRGEEKVKGEKRAERSARKKLIDVEISPTRLSEMINSSIGEAVRSIVEHRSMENKLTSQRLREPERKSQSRRSYIAEEYRERFPDICDNREKTRISQYSGVPIRNGNSFPRNKNHESTLSMPTKNQTDEGSKKHSRLASNVNTDNRRMTGNVNIYICSEAGGNSQQKLKSRLCADTSSSTTTEQSDCRCASASSASSCRLITSVREKRKKLLSQRARDSLREEEGRIGGRVSADDRSPVSSRETRGTEAASGSTDRSSEMPVNAKVDDDVAHNVAASSTRDGGRCEDTIFRGAGHRQGSLDSTIPRPSLNPRDGSDELRQPWVTIYPSEVTAELNIHGAFLSGTICDVERRDYPDNDDASDVCGNDSECVMCDAINDGGWLSKSICTDRAARAEIAGERLASDRNRGLRDSMLDRIWEKQTGRGLRRQSPGGSCRGERAARRWSTCSCIAEEEEEEDYCTNVDRVERESAEGPHDDARSPRGTLVRRAPSAELAGSATVCGTLFNDAEECREESQTCESTRDATAECPRGAAASGATHENSEEPPKVTRVCKEFATGRETWRDITVCETMFAEPRGPPQDVTVCETDALPDSEEAPKETICRILGANFAERDDVKGLSLNDAEDKLASGKTDSANSDGRHSNTASAERKVVLLNSKYNGVASNKFAGNSASGEKRDETIGENVPTRGGRSKLPAAPVASIRNPEPTSRDARLATLPRAGLRGRSNLTVSNRSAKGEAPSTFAGERGAVRSVQLSPFYRRMRGRVQHSGEAPRDLARRDFASSENGQVEARTKGQSRDEGEAKDIPKATEATGGRPKGALLYRSFKRVMSLIRRSEARDETKAEKPEAINAVAGSEKNAAKLKSALETEVKASDEKNRRDVSRIMRAAEPPLVSKQEVTRADAGSPEATVPVTDLKLVAEEDKKEVDIPSTSQAIYLKPKLLRMITAKRSHPPRVETRADSERRGPEAKPLPAGVATTERVPDREEISEPGPAAKVTEGVETKESIAPEVSAAASALGDVADKRGAPEDAENDEAPRPRRKSREKPRESVARERGAPRVERDVFGGCLCDNYFAVRQKADRRPHCRASAAHVCASSRRPDGRLRTEKPRFCGASLSRCSSPVREDCRGTKEECECERVAVCFRCCGLREEWRRCSTRSPGVIDRRRISRDEHRCALAERHETKKARACRRAMICLYCDKPRDKCICRAPIGRCSRCGLPADVCDCRDDESRNRERIVRGPDENRMIQLTSWKPRREIRRYFSRNPEDQNSYDDKGWCSREKSKRQLSQGLPYQRLNVFPDVISELQRKISEFVWCTSCERIPCCCESHVDKVEGKEGRKVKDYVRCHEVGKRGNKSPNNCRCGSSLRNEQTNTVQRSTAVRRVGCPCKLSPCGCKSGRAGHERPLAKCYYCKSSPCTAFGPSMRLVHEAPAPLVVSFFYCILCCSCIIAR